jgi:hypothetical protein
MPESLDGLRQEFSRLEAGAQRGNGQGSASRLEMLLASPLLHTADMQAARRMVATSAAHLPITPEMAWALPQLLKRIQLVSPGLLSTSAVLRTLVARPEWDEPFAKAFTESGFLSCDQAMERVRWKYDIDEMIAKQHDGSAWEVMGHCAALLAQDRTKLPVDWRGVLMELQTLASWFPQLRTIGLLERLYARLCELHESSVAVARRWLDWRAQAGEAAPQGPSTQGARDA